MPLSSASFMIRAISRESCFDCALIKLARWSSTERRFLDTEEFAPNASEISRTPVTTPFCSCNGTSANCLNTDCSSGVGSGVLVRASMNGVAVDGSNTDERGCSGTAVVGSKANPRVISTGRAVVGSNAIAVISLGKI